jgi:hypothetical protein
MAKVVKTGPYEWERKFSWWDRHGGSVLLIIAIAAFAAVGWLVLSH